MKHTLLMVDVSAPGGEVEAEPLVIETDGRLAVLTLDDGTRVSVAVASLVAAVAADTVELRSVA